jgi:hypothetical protein
MYSNAPGTVVQYIYILAGLAVPTNNFAGLQETLSENHRQPARAEILQGLCRELSDK